MRFETLQPAFFCSLLQKEAGIPRAHSLTKYFLRDFFPQVSKPGLYHPSLYLSKSWQQTEFKSDDSKENTFGYFRRCGWDGWTPERMGKHLVRAESFLTSSLEDHKKDRHAQPVREGALLRRSSSQTVHGDMVIVTSSQETLPSPSSLCFCNFAGSYHWFDLAIL